MGALDRLVLSLQRRVPCLLLLLAFGLGTGLIPGIVSAQTADSPPAPPAGSKTDKGKAAKDNKPPEKVEKTPPKARIIEEEIVIEPSTPGPELDLDLDESKTQGSPPASEQAAPDSTNAALPAKPVEASPKPESQSPSASPEKGQSKANPSPQKASPKREAIQKPLRSNAKAGAKGTPKPRSKSRRPSSRRHAPARSSSSPASGSYPPLPWFQSRPESDAHSPMESWLPSACEPAQHSPWLSNVFGPLLFILIALTLSSGLRRLRFALPYSGLIPRVLAVLHHVVHAAVVWMVLIAAVYLLPKPWREALPWIGLASFVALGWSVRDLLPDMFAGFLLFFEHRVRRGRWIEGESYSGLVESIGWRLTWLSDAQGKRVGIPNSRLLRESLRTMRPMGLEREVSLRIPATAHRETLRHVIYDAVIRSPWVPPHAQPTIRFSPAESTLCYVRSRILHARYAHRFEGELSERIEAEVSNA